MLRASRRVLKAGGRLAFLVISVTDVEAPERTRYLEREVARFVDPGRPYPEMLEEAGFEVTEALDMTEPYFETATRWYSAADELEEELRAALGSEEFSEKRADRRASLEAIEAGILSRWFYLAEPSPSRAAKEGP